MSKSPENHLEQLQSYVSPKELKNLDKIAKNSLRSRSDTARLLLVEGMKSYSTTLNLKL